MIRSATSADAGRLAEITVDGWQRAYIGIVPDEVLARQRTDKHRAYFESEGALAPPMRTFVADVGGRVVGYVHGGPARPEPQEVPNGAELWGMYVDPGHGGHSWTLVSALRESFKVDGYRDAYLWVLQDNAPARRFYEAAGWKLDPRASRVEPLPQVRYRIVL